MKELYKELTKTNKKGQLKAIEFYGVKIGLGVLAYLYTEIHTRKTKRYLKALDIVDKLSQKEFKEVRLIINELESEDK